MSTDALPVDEPATEPIDEPVAGPVDGPVDGSAAEPVARLKHPRAIRWLHWINFPLLFVMIWSGLRIYWAEDVYAFGIGSWQWFAFFPEAIYENLDLERRLARGMAFHFAFGWLFVINGVIYTIYLALSGEWRTILPDRRTPKEAKDVVLHDLHLKKKAPPQGIYNAAQRMSYTIVLIMAAIIVVTGFAIYKPTQLYPLPLLFGGYQGARVIHFAMTIGLLLFFLVHVIQVIRAGWNNFRAMVTGYEVEYPGTITDEDDGRPPSDPASGDEVDTSADVDEESPVDAAAEVAR
ncbi:MAG: cytochrome b/b6 domain-containing protein [Acidimicrobiia bacterium]|nr:cytochrome b/b6 domain-containing protein [Acidimicrobiia bacterium]